MVVEKITPEQLLKVLKSKTAVKVLQRELGTNDNINSAIYYTLKIMGMYEHQG